MTNFDFDMDNRQKKIEEKNKKEAAETEKKENGDTISESSKRKPEENSTNLVKKSKKSFKNKIDESGEESDFSSDLSKNGLTTSIYTAKAINQQPGHTSYLTFASLLHKKYLN